MARRFQYDLQNGKVTLEGREVYGYEISSKLFTEEELKELARLQTRRTGVKHYVGDDTANKCRRVYRF